MEYTLLNSSFPEGRLLDSVSIAMAYLFPTYVSLFLAEGNILIVFTRDPTIIIYKIFSIMKTLIFITLILLISGSAVNAQMANTKLRHKISQDVPMKVLTAVEANHPGLNIHQHLIEPASAPKRNKKIRKARKRALPIAKFYLVFTSGKNYYKKELYNQEGILIYSSEKIRNVALPLAVRQYIGREYNGWLLKSVKAIRRIFRDGKELEYYKIVLRNGKDKKHLRLDDQGVIYARK